MVSKFNETLHVLDGPIDPSVRLGVCAMGPVADGDELTWMRVWVSQQDDGRVALASGTSGEHLGGHELSDMEVLPFTDEKGWMVQTRLEPGSARFTDGKPALAMAVAMVRHADGSKDVEQWSQAITVAGDDRDGHGDHDHHH